jgi:hypothetical protein
MIMTTRLEFSALMVRYDGSVIWPVLSRWAFCSRRERLEYARISSAGCNDGICIDVHGRAELKEDVISLKGGISN